MEKQIHKISQILIQYLKKKEIASLSSHKDCLWNEVVKTANRERSARLRKRILFIGSSVAVLLGLAWLVQIYYAGHNTISSDDFSIENIVLQMPKPKEDITNITLFMSDDDHVELSEDANVKYSNTGEVSVNSKGIDDSKSSVSEYNQLIVPSGKRTTLTLSDNTQIWVNSNTRIIYPRNFSGSKREIFIDGEAYLNVAHNKNLPFIVKTQSNFEIEVLGTSFNVCTYKELGNSTVVLVEGSVNITDVNNKQMKLKPDQLVNIGTNGVGLIKNVNTSSYTSWRNGILYLDSQPLGDVLKRLSIYFGVDIDVDRSLKDIQLSGKLVLKDDIHNILDGLSLITPITYSQNNTSYEIKRKKN